MEDSENIESVIQQPESGTAGYDRRKSLEGLLVVVKAGGDVLDRSTALLDDVKAIREQGAKVALVYGGSGELSSRMRENGLKPKFRDGMRVTDEETMKIYMPVMKQRGDDIAAYLGNAETLISGYARRLEGLGYVGEFLQDSERSAAGIIEKGRIAVVSPMAKSLIPEEGYHGMLNCNADSMARGIALSLNPDRFLLATNVEGVMADNQLIREICYEEARTLVNEGHVTGGMMQKVLNAVSYSERTGGNAHIFNGTEKGCLTSAISGENSGTRIYNPGRNRAE